MIKLTALTLLSLSLFAADNWRDQGIIYLDHSPNAVMHPVPVRAVKLGDGFWQPRRRVNVERSIPTMLDLLEVHGIVDNFRRLSGRIAPRAVSCRPPRWDNVARVLSAGLQPARARRGSSCR